MSGTEITKTILNPAANESLQFAANVGSGAGTLAAGNDTRIPTQDENDALQGTDGTPSNANRYVTDSDPRLVSSSVFGNDYQSSVSASTFQTTGTTFLTTVSITTPVLNGTYRVNAHFQFGSNMKAGEVRLYNVTDTQVEGGVSVLTISGTNDFRDFSKVALVTFGGVAKTIRIEYRSTQAGKQQTLRNPIIEIWRVS